MAENQNCECGIDRPNDFPTFSVTSVPLCWKLFFHWIAAAINTFLVAPLTCGIGRLCAAVTIGDGHLSVEECRAARAANLSAMFRADIVNGGSPLFSIRTSGHFRRAFLTEIETCFTGFSDNRPP